VVVVRVPGSRDHADARGAEPVLGWAAKGIPLTRYAIRRLLWLIALLAGVSVLAFVIFYELPSGDQATLRAGPHASAQALLDVRHRLALNDPFYVQYYRYVKAAVLHFDLGYSYVRHTDVSARIFARLPATLSLLVGAAVVWLTIAVTVGTIAALRARSWFDRVAMGLSALTISVPVFLLGMIALYLFSSDVGKFPLLPGQESYVGLTRDAGTWFRSLLMPWLVLGASFAAIYARLVRARLIATLAEDYIGTARAKGLSERPVILRHALRGALTPLVPVAALDIGVLIGGAVLTETVFDIHGVGRLVYDSILSGDLPMIQGIVLFASLFVLVARLIVDLCHRLIDPRLRFA
jgi:peptide/nickel transport system permease protein